ncbi:MAG: hypothetical protein ACLQVI_17050 [Polyangiaceae bacterium]
MRPAHSVITAFVSACAVCILGAGCTIPTPNNAEIGCTYNQQSSTACPGYDAAVPLVDSGPASDAGMSDGAAPEGGGEAGGAVSGLGTSCVSSADCASFEANYCLVSPNGGFPSFCTYTHCTVAICGASYGCCDCSASPLSEVNTYPPGVCVLPTTAAALPSYGCTCESTG